MTAERDARLGNLPDGRVVAQGGEIFHLMHDESAVGYRDYKQVAVTLQKRVEGHRFFMPPEFAGRLQIWVQMPAGQVTATADLTANDLKAIRDAIDLALASYAQPVGPVGNLAEPACSCGYPGSARAGHAVDCPVRNLGVPDGS